MDLVVANHARDSFGHDDNRAMFVTEGECTTNASPYKRIATMAPKVRSPLFGLSRPELAARAHAEHRERGEHSVHPREHGTLGCGAAWSYLRWRMVRLVPALISHGLSTWFVVEFPLWPMGR